MTPCARNTMAAAVCFFLTATAHAQDSGDFAAWFSLNYTPIGSLVPLPPPLAATDKRGSSTLSLRYGRIADDEISIHRGGISGQFYTGKNVAELTGGYVTCDGCDATLMAGGSVAFPLTAGDVRVAVKPAIGIGKFTGDGSGMAFSAAVSLPLSLHSETTSGLVFVPYIEPAFAVGRVSFDGESESGTRPMLGGGLMLASVNSPASIHIGFQKVFLPLAKTTLGVGVSYTGGRR